MRHSIRLDVPHEIIAICSALHRVGREAYPVGGCVRDVLLKMEPKDWDVATSAELEVCLATLSNISGCVEVKPTGEHFPVCRIRFESGNEYEVATFRKDEGKGKETTFEYGTIEDDVKRRDLTINAMFYDLNTQEIVDLVGGYEDLQNKIIRFVGDPTKRIVEDPSRVQRAIRMSIRFDFTIEERSKIAIHQLGREIVSEKVWGKDKVAFERVMIEFNKAAEGDVSTYFEMLKEFDMIPQFLPGLQLEQSQLNFSDIRLIMASILRNEDPRKIRKVLVETCKWPDYSARAISFLVESLNFKGTNVAKLLKSFDSTKLTTDDVKIFSERFMSSDLSKMVTCATTYKETISGDDLLKQGLSGKALGDKKVELEDAEFLKFCNI